MQSAKSSATALARSFDSPFLYSDRSLSFSLNIQDIYMHRSVLLVHVLFVAIVVVAVVVDYDVEERAWRGGGEKKSSVSFRFVSFRFVSLRFVSLRFVSLRFDRSQRAAFLTSQQRVQPHHHSRYDEERLGMPVALLLLGRLGRMSAPVAVMLLLLLLLLVAGSARAAHGRVGEEGKKLAVGLEGSRAHGKAMWSLPHRPSCVPQTNMHSFIRGFSFNQSINQSIVDFHSFLPSFVREFSFPHSHALSPLTSGSLSGVSVSAALFSLPCLYVLTIFSSHSLTSRCAAAALM